jgi:hypothetical protein
MSRKINEGDGRPELFRAALGSLTEGGSTFWRALCAAAVVALTFWMTIHAEAIPAEWETIFLVVIGYYFKDRPLEEKLHRRLAADPRREASDAVLAQDKPGVIGEMTYQFFIATLLVLGAAAAFVIAAPKATISATWIGGVVLAVGFYFKESPIEAVEPWQERFRLFITLEVIAVTVPVLMALFDKTTKHLNFPSQWAGVVLIVITFYFKEKKSATVPPQSEKQKAA